MTDRPANARTPRLLKAVMAWTCLAIAAPVLAAPPAADAPKPAAPPSPLDVERFAFFNTEVRPILLDSCIKCHGGEKVKGELNMTSRAGLLKGGDTGPAVVPERPLESLLLKAISYADDNLLMPPKEKLPADKIAVLTKWVTLGAHMPPDAFPGLKTAAPEHVENPLAGKVTPEAMKFWSFVPVAKPVAPDVKDKAWVKSPIDAFVLAKLEANQLRPAPPANKIALLRRAYYDLTGLPPKSDEVEAFVADASPDAFAKVVDRLLASPQYGEKWGRHWLDLVRFAETNSFERDGIKPNAWRFRDYVIDAFNTDKPYDQFVREQIAGDELDKVTHESIIATGFYRLGQWDDEPSDRVLARYDELDDIVTTVSQGFLGLTINCARCHDHKIDPVTARDYYSLVAVF
ncbi:MAG: DUF1549 domain-containing protein, partial [Phycisphaerae bacterium]|nr:DUF1549 domain-containing protein [Tepidisphaeraceae bacterium]